MVVTKKGKYLYLNVKNKFSFGSQIRSCVLGHRWIHHHWGQEDEERCWHRKTPFRERFGEWLRESEERQLIGGKVGCELLPYGLPPSRRPCHSVVLIASWPVWEYNTPDNCKPQGGDCIIHRLFSMAFHQVFTTRMTADSKARPSLSLRVQHTTLHKLFYVKKQNPTTSAK